LQFFAQDLAQDLFERFALTEHGFAQRLVDQRLIAAAALRLNLLAGPIDIEAR
jgi:hypothetical protein